MNSGVPFGFLHLGLLFQNGGKALQFMNVPGRDCEMPKCCVNEGEIVTSGRSDGLGDHQRSLPAHTAL